MKRDPIFVALTGRGGELARRLAGRFPNSQVHGLADRVEDADVPITAVGDHLRGLFEDRHRLFQIVFTPYLVEIIVHVVLGKSKNIRDPQ